MLRGRDRGLGSRNKEEGQRVRSLGKRREGSARPLTEPWPTPARGLHAGLQGCSSPPAWWLVLTWRGVDMATPRPDSPLPGPGGGAGPRSSMGGASGGARCAQIILVSHGKVCFLIVLCRACLEKDERTPLPLLFIRLHTRTHTLTHTRAYTHAYTHTCLHTHTHMRTLY